MLRLRHRDLVCQQAVELVTDYLEGTLSRGPAAGSRRTWPAARTAPSTWPRCARRSELAGRIEPEDLTPQARDEFVELYRRWRSGQK